MKKFLIFATFFSLCRAQEICCIGVELVSTGGFNATYHDATGNYTSMGNSGEYGRPLYKHNYNEFYIYYLNDPQHRFDGWMVSVSEYNDSAILEHTGNESCINDVIDWEYFDENDMWVADNTIDITCNVVGCCERLNVSSTGPSSTFYGGIFGNYTIQGVPNGKVQYKLDNGNESLSFFVDNPNHYEGWMFHNTTTIDWGQISNDDASVDCPNNVTKVWEYYDDVWLADPDLIVECL